MGLLKRHLNVYLKIFAKKTEKTPYVDKGSKIYLKNV